MKKALLVLLTLIFLFTEISALCGDGQIDINSASLEELDELTGVGPVRAQAIIDTRPFSSVDNLIDVNGIGEVTLDKIKIQNLACVEGEEENTQEDPQEEVKKEKQEEDVIINEKDTSVNNEIVNISEDNKSNIIITSEAVKTIAINPKDIKSETDKEGLNKNKPAIYGLIGFCILLVFLFALKKRNKKKNEFR